MTEELEVGDVVYWDSDRTDRGTVIKKTKDSIFISWKSGDSAWVDYKDCDKVNLYNRRDENV